MTEEEWLTTDNFERLLDYAAGFGSNRLVRLVGCACYRRILPMLHYAESRKALEYTELYADCLIEKEDLRAARQLAEQKWFQKKPDYKQLRNSRETSIDRAFSGVHFLASATDINSVLMQRMAIAVRSAFRAEFSEVDVQRSVYASLIRDIFGNPFRSIDFDPEWQTDTAVGLAQTMYDTRNFRAMPILADALQDAGCEDAAILDHCRDENSLHVRGCWVVDLVLGKA